MKASFVSMLEGQSGKTAVGHRGPGGRLSASSSYYRRVQKVGPAHVYLRNRVAQIMKAALEQALQDQLYSRTPNPVTRKMYDSITAVVTEEFVEVGFNLGEAYYAVYRVNMKGPYVRNGVPIGGDKTLKLAEVVHNRSRTAIKQAERGFLRTVMM